MKKGGRICLSSKNKVAALDCLKSRVKEVDITKKDGVSSSVQLEWGQMQDRLIARKIPLNWGCSVYVKTPATL